MIDAYFTEQSLQGGDIRLRVSCLTGSNIQQVELRTPEGFVFIGNLVDLVRKLKTVPHE